jgi:heme exporter protein A
LSLFICENLNYTIGYKRIFRDLSFTLKSQELWILTGENGAGKSTLLKLLYENRNLAFRSPFPANSLFSYLGHEMGMYSSLSLKENLDFYKSILPTRITNDKIQFLLEEFQLHKRIMDPIHTFSEGMKKKSGIIRALLPNAPILLLDEPFNGLDQTAISALQNILKEYKSQNSIIVATHDPSLLNHFSTGELQLKNYQMEIHRNVARST